ncbi:transcription factor bHLH35-like [Actinidia eriantha]|uniref:transcription factor bHLH35-like n=1 Tax=Actinidia eriantha TaxID=165200 RepID=UPI00259109B7|nr:transcription factor bHLH35-like [Actinidia eriantha]
MEGYSASVIPSLREISPIAAIDEEDWSSRKRRRPRTESRQVERERREKMTEMFSVLQTIVPNLLPKATREEIVTGTIQYIQGLEEELEKLTTLKKVPSPEIMAGTPNLTNWTSQSSTVDVTVSGGGVFFFGIQMISRRNNLVMKILRVFEEHEAEVLVATVVINGGDHQQRRLAVTVTAVVGGDGNTVEKIKREILNL